MFNEGFAQGFGEDVVKQFCEENLAY